MSIPDGRLRELIDECAEDRARDDWQQEARQVLTALLASPLPAEPREPDVVPLDAEVPDSLVPAPASPLHAGAEPEASVNKLKETTMNFGEAIAAMKAGQSVQRAGWNGKNMHIYLEDAFTFPIGDGVFKGQKRDYEPVICMFNAQGKHQLGWLANQPDILAEDWQVVRATT